MSENNTHSSSQRLRHTLGTGPAFRFHYSKPSAVSRQQQPAGGSSTRQQAAAESRRNKPTKEEYLIAEMHWNMERVQRAEVRRVECRMDIK